MSKSSLSSWSSSLVSWSEQPPQPQDDQMIKRPITGLKPQTMTRNDKKHKNESNCEAFKPMFSSFTPHQSTPVGKFSRKVFVGGLPPDIDESIALFSPIFCQFEMNLRPIRRNNGAFPPIWSTGRRLAAQKRVNIDISTKRIRFSNIRTRDKRPGVDKLVSIR